MVITLSYLVNICVICLLCEHTFVFMWPLVLAQGILKMLSVYIITNYNITSTSQMIPDMTVVVSMPRLDRVNTEHCCAIYCICLNTLALLRFKKYIPPAHETCVLGLSRFLRPLGCCCTQPSFAQDGTMPPCLCSAAALCSSHGSIATPGQLLCDLYSS